MNTKTKVMYLNVERDSESFGDRRCDEVSEDCSQNFVIELGFRAC